MVPGFFQVKGTDANWTRSKAKNSKGKVKMPRSDDDAQRRADIGHRDEPEIKPQKNLLICQ